MPPLPLIVEPDELEAHLSDPDLLIVDLCKPDLYPRAHVPGAIHLDYRRLVERRGHAGGLLPDAAALSEILSGLGITPQRHVCAYDDEGGGRASRLLWTLDVVGHEKFSLLNGGLLAWYNEGHPVESQPHAAEPASYPVAAIRRGLADCQYVLSHFADPHVRILDARSRNEYLGLTRFSARNGHIPGAVNLEWTFAMDPAQHLRLKPFPLLRQILEASGITPDKEVIVHCQTHHRSAHTYIMLKALGYPQIRGYAGSWSEWGNREDTPIETDESP
ncbi:MAG: sulfurtransferase [Betaproteobacteria bacterium]|nr:sulfurtransferase [Betaproteobacteria bacterium]